MVTLAIQFSMCIMRKSKCILNKIYLFVNFNFQSKLFSKQMFYIKT